MIKHFSWVSGLTVGHGHLRMYIYLHSNNCIEIEDYYNIILLLQTFTTPLLTTHVYTI